MISPKHFAQVLKNSSLDPQDKVAILNLLPTLTPEQIEEIGKILEEDNAKQEDALSKAKLKVDVLMKKLGEEKE